MQLLIKTYCSNILISIDSNIPNTKHSDCSSIKKSWQLINVNDTGVKDEMTNDTDIKWSYLS